MITFYIRSSMLGTFDMCQMKAFFVYCLGMKDKENKKANMGTVVHKVLELFGRQKMSDPKRKTIDDDELGRIKKSECTVEYLTELALSHYEEKTNGLVTVTSDLKKCIEWVYNAINYSNGKMDPRNQNIQNVEEFFDIEIKEDWAKYEYEVNGQKITGHLRIRGTVDVIIQEDDNMFRVLDYKTGRRYNWSTDEVKTPKKLKNDKQLLFYYYALRKKYESEKRDFFLSIFYINDHKFKAKGMSSPELVKGGVFDFAFDDEDYKRAEKMVKEEFEKIKNTTFPKPISYDLKNFKCKYLCRFSEIIPEIDFDEPACVIIRKRIKEEGIDAVTNDFIDLDKSMNYQDGGGRSADTEKKDKKK